jgi:hypothetical protein
MAERVPIDLHIHTALSPCAGEEMKPPAILLAAERRGIKVVGVVDHSTARNAPAVLEAAAAFEVRALVGLETESTEGVHVLTLFDAAEPAMAMDRIVAEHLPDRENRIDVFGAQHLLDVLGDIVGEDPRLLCTATDLSIEEIVKVADGLGGLSIPAHIDRRANGLLPTLGFIPPGLRADLWELSPNLRAHQAREVWPELQGRALVNGSDAHFLADIGCAPTWVSHRMAGASLRPTDWGRELAQELLSSGE